MKDLSKLEFPKKPKQEAQREPEVPKANKKKKILIIAIVCLLSIAVASKLINKHLKKIKIEEKKAQIEKQAEQSKANKDKQSIESSQEKTSNAESPDFTKKTPNGKMVFTFYDNLKHDSVKVDVEPQAQRAQYKYTYIYQIASFRNMNETSWYVKKMKEDGLNPQFKRVGNWIRMYIGPYDSKRAMAPDIIKLQRLGLNGGFPREVSRTKIEPQDTSSAGDKKGSDSENESNNKSLED